MMDICAGGKPIILLVTGAWHPPIFYASLQKDFERFGFECIIPHLPSMGASDEHRGVTWAEDKAKVLDAAVPVFKTGREIVLIAHSYGGVPACAATEGESIKERAKRGKLGGFRAIIFLAAFAIPCKGWDLLTTFGGKWPDWQDTAVPYSKASVGDDDIPFRLN